MFLKKQFIYLLQGEGHLDERDMTWENDSELKPVDLNKLAARHFVVYKFGCHVADLIR